MRMTSEYECALNPIPPMPATHASHPWHPAPPPPTPHHFCQSTNPPKKKTRIAGKLFNFVTLSSGFLVRDVVAAAAAVRVGVGDVAGSVYGLSC